MCSAVYKYTRMFLEVDVSTNDKTLSENRRVPWRARRAFAAMCRPFRIVNVVVVVFLPRNY